MKQEEEIIRKYGKDPGMRVPEGYFTDLQRQIMDQLPPYQMAEPVIKMSRWQRMKPYVYLAAMFCGIWVMMKVFHTASQPMLTSLDNPPEVLVQYLNEELEDDLQFMPSSPDLSIEEDVIMDYDSIEEFEQDFGYQLSPEYSVLTVPGHEAKLS